MRLRPIVRSLAAGGAASLLLSLGGAGVAMADSDSTATCTAPTLSQPFLSEGDSNWYTLAPGESADDFAGTGWMLLNGANITTTQLADGSTGSVLDLPAGAIAVSPPVCVESDYPDARTMIQGGAVAVGVYHPGTLLGVDLSGVISGSGQGWTLSNPFQVHPSDTTGWQLVRFAFTGAGVDAQLYDFYIDPRMSD